MLHQVLRGFAMALSSVGLMSFGGQAAALDRSVLYNQDGWELQHEIVAKSGAQVCTVTRLNGHGDRLDLALWADNRFELYLSMASDFDSWYGDFRGRALLSIDDSPWLFHNATYAPYGLSISFPDADIALKFLKQMHAGDEVILYTPEGHLTVADWSLYGFDPVLTELANCKARITGRG